MCLALNKIKISKKEIIWLGGAALGSFDILERFESF